MRPLQSGVILVAFLTVLASYSASQNVADIVKQSSDAVVLIVISNSAGQETALGSGFLVSSDGEIVTNYHVIKEAHSAVVKLSNGAFFPVNGVLATDTEKDLAVIKVSGKNLPFLSLGDIDKLHIGDHVVAIGSPLGLEGTVSDGIVSAIRDVDKKKWIQTTAPASHGNSGGPLLDMNNHVIGVVAMGVNPELGQNLNFAIPSSEVTALLIAAHQQAKSLDSIANKNDASFTEGTVWTSLTSGHTTPSGRTGTICTRIGLASLPK
jgi:serine protease Do